MIFFITFESIILSGSNSNRSNYSRKISITMIQMLGYWIVSKKRNILLLNVMKYAKLKCTRNFPTEKEERRCKCFVALVIIFNAWPEFVNTSFTTLRMRKHNKENPAKRGIPLNQLTRILLRLNNSSEKKTRSRHESVCTKLCDSSK